MTQKTYLSVVSVFFLIVAIFHLLRIIFGWYAQIGGWEMPLWPSFFAVVISGALSAYGFFLAAKK